MSANRLRAGTAKRDVTPETGAWLSGFASRVSPSEGTHDPLWAKALVLEADNTTVSIVACDVAGLTTEVTTPARTRIESRCGIPADHVMICSSHTHSGPDTMRLTETPADDAYLNLFANAIADAVADGMSQLQPASAGWGRGNAVGISVNRRAFEAGPLDTEVGILKIADDTGRTIAVVANFACHPVTLGGDNLLFSADFPGYAMDMVEAAEPGALALFVNGAFGNVNTGHRADLPVGDRGERTFERAEALGRILADEVIRVLPDISCAPDSPISAATRPLSLPTRPVPDMDWATAEENVASARAVLSDPGSTIAEKRQAVSRALYDRELLLLRSSHTPTIESEVMALRVGDGLLAGVPAEYFIEYAIALKAAAPLPFTFLAALVNDWIGYVPTPAAFPEGGYETKLCRWSKLDPESGDRIYDALLAVAKAVAQEQPAPARPNEANQCHV